MSSWSCFALAETPMWPPSRVPGVRLWAGPFGGTATVEDCGLMDRGGGQTSCQGHGRGRGGQGWLWAVLARSAGVPGTVPPLSALPALGAAASRRPASPSLVASASSSSRLVVVSPVPLPLPRPQPERFLHSGCPSLPTGRPRPWARSGSPQQGGAAGPGTATSTCSLEGAGTWQACCGGWDPSGVPPAACSVRESFGGPRPDRVGSSHCQATRREERELYNRNLGKSNHRERSSLRARLPPARDPEWRPPALP